MCYLRLVRLLRAAFRLEIRDIFCANTARFAANPPLFFAAAIFLVVALPNAPTVPLRFILETAF